MAALGTTLNRLTQLYQPRTYLVPGKQRAELSPPGLVSWIPAVFQTSDRVILQKSGLDAFFFLRYLRTLLKIFVPLSLIVIPVLVPLNLVHGKNAPGGVQGLDRLSWANVGLAHTSFYWAHLLMALTVTIFICHTIYAELIEYVSIRQAYLESPQHRLQAFANAILVTDIPKRCLNIPTLTRLYGVFPGGIRTIWINRDLSELSKKVLERGRIVCTLEAAETKLIRLAMKSSGGRTGRDLTKTEMGDEEPLWKRYLGERDRDYMRLPIFNLTWMPSMPFVGRKVDTIHHCWQEMARLNKEIDQDQQEPDKYPLLTSAFIQFNTQEATYMACQSLRQFASSNGTTNRLVYSRPNQERHAETEMGEANKFASDAVGHPFPNLYQPRLHRATCVSQAVIMIIATAMTLGFQFLLNDAVAPLLRFMPQTEMREEEQEAKHHGTGGTVRILARQCLKRLTPTRHPNSVHGIFSSMHHDMEDSTADDRVSLAFQHGSLCIQRPMVWIPADRLGISDDEISRIKQQYSNVSISNEHASLGGKGRVTITQDASDLSELGSMKL
ncbi:hypothetical protein OEA41_008693 [Lepraria neglecta]|uniref:Uncharacterized protein n=1 Tax=Lepraria neglecta TaxID=209136 RepID=A0AAD9Z0F9_9LECA|nr:hypothetical protein OEA41_008693 [Lepraria neglecta]